ncbi:hypothetical protein AMTR_s00052p00227440 [Amborella trichopoda]|uniref:Uncharacterized protein n=1 Tax=Amborella trichopoda TaxID=13333 RepID=U5D7X2_AMBTC|nr:hypothetical protein AMTR_s00052p00227440 [Amborella trichopoda]
MAKLELQNVRCRERKSGFVLQGWGGGFLCWPSGHCMKGRLTFGIQGSMQPTGGRLASCTAFSSSTSPRALSLSLLLSSYHRTLSSFSPYRGVPSSFSRHMPSSFSRRVRSFPITGGSIPSLLITVRIFYCLTTRLLPLLSRTCFLLSLSPYAFLLSPHAFFPPIAARSLLSLLIAVCLLPSLASRLLPLLPRTLFLLSLSPHSILPYCHSLSSFSPYHCVPFTPIVACSLPSLLITTRLLQYA